MKQYSSMRHCGGGGLKPGGGIPGGGMPGRNPGGGMPGGGIPGRKPGGGMPGGGIPGGGRIIGGARTCGIIMPGAGPPTPGAGPARPAGANPGAGAGMPRPAARPIPGPPAAAAAARTMRASSAGGGPSTVRSITSSPRKMTRPSTLRCSRSSSEIPFFGGSFLNSSASPSTRFMWRSKAMNLPTICLPSVTVTRMPAHRRSGGVQILPSDWFHQGSALYQRSTHGNLCTAIIFRFLRPTS